MRALVTGAGKRLGRAMALSLAQRGYDVAVHYSSSGEDAASVVAQIAAMGRRAVAVQADLLDEAQTATLIARAVAGLSGPLGVQLTMRRSLNMTRCKPRRAAAGTGIWNRTCARRSC